MFSYATIPFGYYMYAINLCIRYYIHVFLFGLVLINGYERIYSIIIIIVAISQNNGPLTGTINMCTIYHMLFTWSLIYNFTYILIVGIYDDKSHMQFHNSHINPWFFTQGVHFDIPYDI